MMAKMIHTKAGYMTAQEAKIIGDLDREEKMKKRKEQKSGSKKRRN